MKILLLGKNGQVGWELQRSLAPLGELIALDRHSADWCGDLSNLPGLTKLLFLRSRLCQPQMPLRYAERLWYLQTAQRTIRISIARELNH